MAERKFQVVRERPVGHLPKDLNQKWARLVARQANLVKMQERLDASFKRFINAYADRVNIKDPGERAAYRGFKLDEDGTVSHTYCDCPACQAQLQGLSVSATVEEMVREQLVDPSAIRDMRARALELDAKEQDAVKTALLVN